MFSPSELVNSRITFLQKSGKDTNSWSISSSHIHSCSTVNYSFSLPQLHHQYTIQPCFLIASFASFSPNGFSATTTQLISLIKLLRLFLLKPESQIPCFSCIQHPLHFETRGRFLNLSKGNSVACASTKTPHRESTSQRITEHLDRSTKLSQGYLNSPTSSTEEKNTSNAAFPQG